MFLGIPDPDPLVRGTDPGIRIRTKMSRIPNTARKSLGRNPCSWYPPLTPPANSARISVAYLGGLSRILVFFHPGSRIQQEQKRVGGKNFPTFLCSHKFHTIVNYSLFLKGTKSMGFIQFSYSYNSTP
jgi:hypothetical protein